MHVVPLSSGAIVRSINTQRTMFSKDIWTSVMTAKNLWQRGATFSMLSAFVQREQQWKPTALPNACLARFWCVWRSSSNVSNSKRWTCFWHLNAFALNAVFYPVDLGIHPRGAGPSGWVEGTLGLSAVSGEPTLNGWMDICSKKTKVSSSKFRIPAQIKVWIKNILSSLLQ